MMTMSKALGAAQAKDYYQAEYTNTQESYYTEDENVKGEWFGKQADAWQLEGEVTQEPFERLRRPRPRTGMQLVRHIPSKKYENAYGDGETANTGRLVFNLSAPKSVSLAAFVAVMRGSWRRIKGCRAAPGSWRSTLKLASAATIRRRRRARLCRQIQARRGASRPSTGYAAPQLHRMSLSSI